VLKFDILTPVILISHNSTFGGIKVETLLLFEYFAICEN